MPSKIAILASSKFFNAATDEKTLDLKANGTSIALLSTCHDSRSITKGRYRLGSYSLRLDPLTDLPFLKNHIPTFSPLKLITMISSGFRTVAVLFSPANICSPSHEARLFIHTLFAIVSHGGAPVRILVVVQGADENDEQGKYKARRICKEVVRGVEESSSGKENPGFEVLPEIEIVLVPFGICMNDFLLQRMKENA